MGYTHYWTLNREIPRERWSVLMRGTEKLIKAFDRPLEEPVIDDEVLVLNGARPEGFETFVLERSPDDFGFCKTGHRPYDKLVCAVLSVAAQQCPELSVSSDANMGSLPDGWPAAARWATKVVGYEVSPPWNYSWRRRMRLAFHTVLGR